MAQDGAHRLLLGALLSCCIVVASSMHSLSSMHHVLPHNAKFPATNDDITTVDTMVIGGGISGTTTAYYLHKNGSSVLVADEQAEVENEYLWEEGPNSFQPTLAIMTLLRDLNLQNDVVFADASLPRYIFFNNRMHTLPRSILNVFRSTLLSWEGKLGIFLGSLGLVSRRPAAEESIDHFITRHFGKEVMQRCVDPFISGVYAGSPQHISAHALAKVTSLEGKYSRSLFINAMLRSLFTKKRPAISPALPMPPPGSLGSVKQGMQSIPKQIKGILGNRVLTSARVNSVHRVDNYYITNITHDNRVKIVRSRNVLVTVPAHRLSSILEYNQNNSDSTAFRRLASLATDVYYPPVVSVTLAYPVSSLRNPPLVGFGHLIPRVISLRTLGTIYASSLFQGRARDSYVMVRSFIGGSTNPTVVSFTDCEIVQQVHDDLQKTILSPNAAPPRVLSVWRWNKAIPQYEIGHRDRVAEMKELASRIPGLYLSGSYLSGVSVGDCIEYSMKIAKNISERPST